MLVMSYEATVNGSRVLSAFSVMRSTAVLIHEFTFMIGMNCTCVDNNDDKHSICEFEG